MRKITALFLLMTVLCSALFLGSCGGDEATENSKDVSSTVSENADVNSSEESTPASEESVSVDDGKVEYTVKVTDNDGKAMAGVMVQLCLNSCIPKVTDANGTAIFNVEEADYKVSVMTMPEGYTYATDTTEYHFEEGSTSLTIVLTSAE